MIIKELKLKSIKIESALSFDKNANCKIFTFINSYSYLTLRNNNITLSKFDGIFYDGFLMKMFVNFFLNKSIKRVSFDMTSLAPILIQKSIDNKKSIFIIGAKTDEITGFVKTIKSNYPKLNIIGYRNGYFSINERREIIEKINKLSPDIVIVGMGTPLQENFLIDLKESDWTGLGFTCGGFIHQTSKKLYYYPNWVNYLNLRWLYRLVDEPKLIKRFLNSYIRFPIIFVKDIILMNKEKHI